MRAFLLLLSLLSLSLSACGGQTTLATGGDGSVPREAGAPDASDAARDVSTDSSQDVTSDSADARSCGRAGGSCCPGEACNEGGCCVDDVCIAGGQTCGDGLGACKSGSCGACGGVGQACCLEVMSDICSGVMPNCPGCTASGTTCLTNGSNTGGTCIACGTEGAPCCGVGLCLSTFAICDASGKCSSKCGAPGEPCCTGDTGSESCRDGGCCMLSPTSSGASCVASPTCGCSDGLCTTCGRNGLACCSGQSCQFDQGMCTEDGPDAGSTCTIRMGP
jgi:hypothetical protein